MNKLYYFKYNNYVNRVIKGHAYLNEYLEDTDCIYLGEADVTPTNFNKLSEKEANITYIGEAVPDYVIVADKTNLNIISSWFVINETRKNQTNYKLELKRDLVWDNLIELVNCESTLVKRGYAPKTNDSILNHEREFSFNEYKRNEVKMKQNNNSWLAIFVGTNLKEKMDVIDTISHEEIYITTTSDLDVNSSSQDSIQLKNDLNSKGYGIILIPFAIFEHPDYELRTAEAYKVGNTKTSAYVNCKRDNTNTNVNRKMYGYDVINIINNQIISNESYVDIQVIPSSDVNYANYTVNETYNYIETEYIKYDSVGNKIQNLMPLMVQKVYNNVPEYVSAMFPITLNPNVSISFDYTLTDLGIGSSDTDRTKLLDNPKLLEAYKVYLQSADRTSNIEIDLRKYINKTSDTLSNSFKFDMNIMYQPFQSFMYVKPHYNDNYFETNDVDDKGLICGYNNQVLRTTNAWLSFLLSNKNYLNSFNLEMRDSYINTATGALSGAIGGATTGAMVGGVYGAVAGAVIGGVTATVQGLVNTDEKRKEFNWNCDNLKSKPNAISKVASFTPQNSIYPTLNIYYNDEVVNGLFDKYLKYNGYTINKIGKIIDYISEDYNYVVAEIFRFEKFTGSADDLLEIQNEFERGLYLDCYDYIMENNPY